jgi:hypothetical protein
MKSPDCTAAAANAAHAEIAQKPTIISSIPIIKK